MSTQSYTHKRGDSFSLGGTVSGLPSGTIAVRAQIRNPIGNAKVEDLVVTLGAYVDSMTPRTLLLTAPPTDTTNWPTKPLSCDIEFTEPDGTVISSQTFVVTVVPDITYG